MNTGKEGHCLVSKKKVLDRYVNVILLKRRFFISVCVYVSVIGAQIEFELRILPTSKGCKYSCVFSCQDFDITFKERGNSAKGIYNNKLAESIYKNIM